MTAIKKPYNPVTVIERMIADYTVSREGKGKYDPYAAEMLGSHVCRFCPERVIEHLSLSDPFYQEYQYYQNHPNFSGLAELEADPCCLDCEFTAVLPDSDKVEKFSCYVPVSHLAHVAAGHVTYKGTRVVLDWDYYIAVLGTWIFRLWPEDDIDRREINEEFPCAVHHRSQTLVNRPREITLDPPFCDSPPVDSPSLNHYWDWNV